MKTIGIPTEVCSCSLVYVQSTFPRGWGNYFSTYDSSTGICYDIVNLSFEDMRDAKKLDIIDDVMVAEVYDTSNENVKVAFIVDTRLPKICLTPEWFYGNRFEVIIPILRKKYNVPEGACLCEFDESRDSGISFNRYNYNNIPGYIISYGKCLECGKEYKSVKKNNHG